MAGRSSLWLLSLLAAAAGGGGSLLLDGGAAASPPVSEYSVVSQAMLADPLNIEVSGPSDVEMAQLTIEPGGTSGIRRYAGPALVSVVGGTASRYQVEGGSCRSTTVLPGAAYVVSPGEVDEIRNEGASPLHLQTTSFAPAGELWAASASGMAGCGASTAKGFSAAVLTQTSLPDPARIKADGPSAIVVARVVLPPGATVAGWHSHPAATLVSVEHGRFDVPAVVDGRCVRKLFREGTGFVEPAGEVHDGRNDGRESTTVYVLGISFSAGPMAIPQAPPSQCSANP